MSKINIQGTIDNIRSKSNVYTPIIEAIVNSIDSIQKSKTKNGEVKVIVKRDAPGLFNEADQLPFVRHVEIHDNGSGFTKVNRDSFDTFYSDTKKDIGGKGFGRFLFLKYFNEVKIQSNYKETDNKHYLRTFTFGRKDEIIISEKNITSENKKNNTIIYLNHLQDDKSLDKELTTIARKLLEKLLIFFVSETAICPKILVEDFASKEKIILNDYLNQNKEIITLSSKTFSIHKDSKTAYPFTAKIFKVYYSTTDSKVILTGHNREVTQSTLHTYVPEFEDEFYDTFGEGEKATRKNYSIKIYILGKYLDDNVSLERETFNFDKDKATLMYDLSQVEIEREAANLAKTLFSKEVKVRSDKKVKRIREYVNNNAPWHKTYVDKVDYSEFSYTMTDERIELELQKYKFQSEQNNRADLNRLLKDASETEFDQKLSQLASKITDTAKADLAHYVCSRKLILETLDALRQRNEEGKAKLEDEVHSLIYPMNKDSENTPYESHNLWILDERLVFSEYVASDRKISKKKGAIDEPDLVVFIYPVSHNDSRFVGDAKINLSSDERDRYCPTKEILPEYLVSSSYGCMFQAYYLKGSFDECFKLNGADDEQKWYGALRDNKLDDYRSEITANEKKLFNKLVEENLLDKFMSLNPDKYLTKIDSTNYVVNIDLLREDAKAMIDEHVPVYSELIQKNKEVVDKHTKQ